MNQILAMTLVLIWLIVVAFFRIHKIWLLYYLIGSVGFAFALIFVGQSLIPIEPMLESAVAWETHVACAIIGVNTRVFQAAPGLLLVLVVSQNPGWTTIQVTIECSGLLESAVLMGMLGFYPGWPVFLKIWLGVIGLLLTHVANLIRLMLIILTLHLMGKDSLFMAHTIVGRAVFFVAVVVIYWSILTLPTLRTVRLKLQREMER